MFRGLSFHKLLGNVSDPLAYFPDKETFSIFGIEPDFSQIIYVKNVICGEKLHLFCHIASFMCDYILTQLNPSANLGYRDPVVFPVCQLSCVIAYNFWDNEIHRAPVTWTTKGSIWFVLFYLGWGGRLIYFPIWCFSFLLSFFFCLFTPSFLPFFPFYK